MHMFKLSGFGDEISPELDVQLSVMKKLGMQYIEPRGVDGVNVSELTGEQAQSAKKRMNAAGIRVSSVGSPIGKISINDDFAAHLDVFRNTVEVAKIFETQFIRIFSFYIPEGESADAYEEPVVDRLRQLTEIAAQNNLVLLHENERGIFGDRSNRCKILADRLYGDHFKLLFDPANYVQCGEPDCLDAFRLLRPYTAYMHVKDALRHSGEVVPAGMGDGQVRSVLSQLRAEGYDGFLSIEPHLAHFDGVDAFDKFNHLSRAEEAGERTFSIAHQALTDLLQEIK